MAMNDDERARALNPTPKPNSFGDAAAAMASPGVTVVNTGTSPAKPGGPISKSLSGQGVPGSAVSQIPQDDYKAPPADGSMNNPMNSEVGRNLSNAANALSAMPGASAALNAGANLAGRAIGGAAASAAPAVAGMAAGAERAWQGASTAQRLAATGAGGVGLYSLGNASIAAQAGGGGAQPSNSFGDAAAVFADPRVTNVSAGVGPVAPGGPISSAAVGQSAAANSAAAQQPNSQVGAASAANPAGGGRVPEAPGGKPALSATELMQQMVGRNTPAQQVPWSGVIGGDPAMANAQRERSDLISSLTSVIPGAKGITAAQRSGLITLLNNEQQDATSRANNAANNQAHQQVTDMNNDAAMQRAAVQMASGLLGNQNDLAKVSMQEQGANQRSALHEQGSNQRNALQTLGTLQAAQTKADAAGKQPPQGYRYLPNGNLQAITGGPADPAASKEGQQQTKDSQDVFSIIDQARPLFDKATGSYAGNAADQVARTFGVATEGAQAAAQLKALQGALVSKMPKMSGPQSDKDVQLYRKMAGQIGDPTIPSEQRMAAMKTVEDLNMKYLPVASDAAAYQALQAGSYYKTPDGSVRRKQ